MEEDKVDVQVRVKEKPTGQFSIGGGFSTLDRFTAIANITEGNLFGLGYLVRIRGQVGVRRTIGVLTFRNPALVRRPHFLPGRRVQHANKFLDVLGREKGWNGPMGKGLFRIYHGKFYSRGGANQYYKRGR